MLASRTPSRRDRFRHPFPTSLAPWATLLENVQLATDKSVKSEITAVALPPKPPVAE